MSKNNDFNTLIKSLVRDFMPSEDKEKVTDNMIEEATNMALTMLPDFKKFQESSPMPTNIDVSHFRNMMKNMKGSGDDINKIIQDTNTKIGKLQNLNKNINENMSKDELDNIMKETQEEIKKIESEKAPEKIDNFITKITATELPQEPKNLESFVKNLPIGENINITNQELENINKEFKNMVLPQTKTVTEKPMKINRIKKSVIKPITIEDTEPKIEPKIETKQEALNHIKITKKKVSHL